MKVNNQLRAIAKLGPKYQLFPSLIYLVAKGEAKAKSKA